MGMDLTIVIVDHGVTDNWWLCYDRLSLARDYDLFGQIDEVRGDGPRVTTPKPVPETARVQWYGDEGIRTINTNPYGVPLTYILPWELKRINLETINPRNVPVIEFLSKLPDHTALLLYWH